MIYQGGWCGSDSCWTSYHKQNTVAKNDINKLSCFGVGFLINNIDIHITKNIAWFVFFLKFIKK